MQYFRRLFFAGVFTIAPIALTIYIVILLGGWFDRLFQPLVQPLVAPYYDKEIPGLGIILGVMFIVLVGAFAPSFVGRQLLRYGEALVARLPLIKLVYKSAKTNF